MDHSATIHPRLKAKIAEKKKESLHLSPEGKKTFFKVFDEDIEKVSRMPGTDRNILAIIYTYVDKYFINELGSATLNKCIKILEDPLQKYPSDEDKLHAMMSSNGIKNVLPNFSAHDLGIGLDDIYLDHLLLTQLRLYRLNAKTSGNLVSLLADVPDKSIHKIQVAPIVPSYQKFIVANLLLLLTLKEQREKQKIEGHANHGVVQHTLED